MTYYKLIKNDNTFVGVATSDALLRYQNKHKILLNCDIQTAQYIMCKDNIYRCDWLVPENSDQRGKYQKVDLIEITEDEYNSLVEEYEIPAPQEEQTITDDELQDLIAESTLDHVVEMKIKQIKNACKNVIENGFDIELSEGVIHFSLTAQDQQNITLLAILSSGGVETDKYPYHADGEYCVYYSAAEIAAIAREMQATIAKNTIYFNSLKKYIDSLRTVEDVKAVYWGMPIPQEYQSAVYNDFCENP